MGLGSVAVGYVVGRRAEKKRAERERRQTLREQRKAERREAWGCMTIWLDDDDAYVDDDNPWA